MVRYFFPRSVNPLTCTGSLDSSCRRLFFVRCRRRSKYCLKGQRTSFTQNKTLKNGSENTIHYKDVSKQGHNNRMFLINIMISIEQFIVDKPAMTTVYVKILVFTKIQKPIDNWKLNVGIK